MNANQRYPPGLCRINLITGDVTEYALPVRILPLVFILH